MVTFLAETALEIAKEKAPDAGYNITPSTATQLREKMYNDDGVIAALSKE